jgi:hypothetical protein
LVVFDSWRAAGSPSVRGGSAMSPSYHAIRGVMVTMT